MSKEDDNNYEEENENRGDPREIGKNDLVVATLIATVFHSQQVSLCPGVSWKKQDWTRPSRILSRKPVTHGKELFQRMWLRQLLIGYAMWAMIGAVFCRHMRSNVMQ
ncbi:hypothetical protein Q3G72_027141 [Acer saccharum]|nr:hypothetical protein Q3G72_027141 [Acer saccharum]